MQSDILAVIFDYDDTLVPDSTTKLLRAHDVDADKFWKDARELVKKGYDAAPAYLNMLLDLIGDEKPLGPLTNDKLRAFGATLDAEYFLGIPDLFVDLRKEVTKILKDGKIEFYIISGGLKPIIEGSRIVKEHFQGVYASELGGQTPGGTLRHIKRCITFTEKTRYLFEINKGVDPAVGAGRPELVNRYVKKDQRRIPFRNMIYVGDGHTDIPCFSLVGKGTYAEPGGTAFAVFDKTKPDKAKDAFREFLKAGRVTSMHFPRYREDDELGALLRQAVAARCSDIAIRGSEAESEEE
ncbi:MAG TPA: HAD family hydrolase [Candidatus Binatia bacterium]|nr:HAD family hydrolase [Candidatus Binatia bacterium]